ncbi:MAG TPA: hypothetical protein VLL52_12645, partial [Anaerolineae bacterium]|nr:hypothetical protein [Anaerolineae bacterium]
VGAQITGEAIGQKLAQSMEDCMDRMQGMVSSSVERGISKGVQDLAPIIRADTINVTDRIVAIEKKIDELAEINRNRRGRL